MNEIKVNFNEGTLGNLKSAEIVTIINWIVKAGIPSNHRLWISVNF